MRIAARRVRAIVVGMTSLAAILAVAGGGPLVPPLSASQTAVGQAIPTPTPTPAIPAPQLPAELPKGTGLLMGQVVDAAGKKPIGSAIVTISGGTPTQVVLPTGEILVSNPAAVPPGTTPDAPRQLLTDAQGHFMFRALTAGRYLIRVTAPGYISGGYGQTRPGGSTQSVELLKDDEKRGDLSIKMWKAATIAGTVVDEAGEPVIGISIRVFRRTLLNGRPQLAPSSQATTDDRGFYRLPGLTPGDYLVGLLTSQSTMPAATAEAYMQQIMAGGSSLNSDIYRELSNSGASPGFSGGMRVGDLILQTNNFGRSASPPPPTDDGRVFAYPSVFYPSAAVASQATVLTLASGEDRVRIDLHLKLVPTVRVSGTVMGPDGPARNLGVKLFPAGADEFTSESGVETASTATDANGQFTFLGVTPGQYTLKSLRVPRPLTSSSSTMTNTIEISGPGGMIMGMSSGGPSTAPPPPLPTELTMWATTTVNVGEIDVAGLSVTLRPGARISGRLMFEGTKEPPAPEQLQRAGVSITPIVGSGPSQLFSAAKRVETTGQFASVGYPPGRYLVTASVPSPLPVPGAPPVSGGSTWRFKSAMFDGHDVSDEGLVIEAEDIEGIVITFTDRATDVTGSVTDAKGQPDRGAIVVVLPADSQSWKLGNLNARRTRSVRTTTTGAFSFGALPPGAYFIAAISDETLENWQDPKTLEAITRVATRFTLGDGEKTSQALTTRVLR